MYMYICIYIHVGMQRDQALKMANFLGISEESTDNVSITCTWPQFQAVYLFMYTHFNFWGRET